MSPLTSESCEQWEEKQLILLSKVTINVKIMKKVPDRSVNDYWFSLNSSQLEKSQSWVCFSESRKIWFASFNEGREPGWFLMLTRIVFDNPFFPKNTFRRREIFSQSPKISQICKDMRQYKKVSLMINAKNPLITFFLSKRMWRKLKDPQFGEPEVDLSSRIMLYAVNS